MVLYVPRETVPRRQQLPPEPGAGAPVYGRRRVSEAVKGGGEDSKGRTKKSLEVPSHPYWQYVNTCGRIVNICDGPNGAHLGGHCAVAAVDVDVSSIR